MFSALQQQIAKNSADVMTLNWYLGVGNMIIHRDTKHRLIRCAAQLVAAPLRDKVKLTSK